MRTLPILTLAALAVFAASPQLSAQAESQPLQVEIRLANGSRIRGAVAPRHELTLETPYGNLSIPFREIRGIGFGEEGRLDHVTTHDGAFSGNVATEAALEVDTGYGVLNVPFEGIRSLKLRPEDGEGDDFEGPDLDRWRVYQGSWQLRNGRLVGIGNSTYYGQIFYDAEIDIEYTLEVTISGNGQHAGVIWNADSESSGNVLWFQGGMVYAYGGSPWWNTNTATFNCPTLATYEVKLQVRGGTGQLWVNGQSLGTVNGLGAGKKVGLFSYAGEHSFDDFKISF